MTCLRVDRAARLKKRSQRPGTKNLQATSATEKQNPREFQMKNRRWFCPRSTGELPGTCHPPKGSQGAVVLPDPWVKASGGPPPVERDEARLVSSVCQVCVLPASTDELQGRPRTRPPSTLIKQSVSVGAWVALAVSMSKCLPAKFLPARSDELQGRPRSRPPATLIMESVSVGAWVAPSRTGLR